VRKISCRELLRFKVGLDGLPYRRLGPGDSAAAIIAGSEVAALASAGGFHHARLEDARLAGARIAIVAVGREAELAPLRAAAAVPDCVTVAAAVPDSDFLLDGVARAGLKMLLNALSTCTMVRLGRVMGNYMVWLVPSNLKLIDRATRYIQKLAGLEYAEANRPAGVAEHVGGAHVATADLPEVDAGEPATCEVGERHGTEGVPEHRRKRPGHGATSLTRARSA
jgi:hypothetical protein